MRQTLLLSLIFLSCLTLLSATADGLGTVGEGKVEHLAPPTGAGVQPRHIRLPVRKVTNPLLAELDASGEADFLVFVAGRPDLTPARALPTKEAKGAWVYKRLRQAAESSQAGLRRFLDAWGIAYQPFWIVNMLRIHGDAALVRELARRPEVTAIDINLQFRSLPPVLGRGKLSSAPLLPSPSAPWLPDTPASLLLEPTVGPWGVSHIGAPDVWGQGIRGQGIVVAGADTGVAWDHEALIGRYRGWDGQAADHNYHWRDAWNKTPTYPSDDAGHGTHTLGTVVGGGARHIGVAPGARWIACRNMRNGFGTPASYVDCFQFFLAPTDLEGKNPRPDLAPHVVNNSWACVRSEGCRPDDPLWEDTIQPAVEALAVAGIAVVASAGNSGALGCGTVDTPPAIYAEAFSVGASEPGDAIAGFSSRGPITVNGSSDPAPDLAAPGVDVLSSVPDDGSGNVYTWLSGTSTASPHVAGTIALLWSAAPELIGRLSVTEQVLRSTAVPVADSTCGGDADGQPNNVYGWGVINAQAAVEAAGTLGEIRGTVTDVDGNPLGDVEVTVIDRVWDVQIELLTDDDGRYTTPVMPGTYRMVADTDAHFAETRRIQVLAGHTTTRDLMLSACADWDGDGQTGLFELQRVAGDWRNPNFETNHDLNGDGQVNILDVAELTAHLSESCR